MGRVRCRLPHIPPSTVTQLLSLGTAFHVPVHASLPPHLPQRVCQGIRFCAILNNSIFIGPTKKHLLPLCALPGHGLLTPTMGHIALSAFPVPLSLCAPPQKPSRAPVIPSLLGAGRGAWCQEPALATSMGTPGMGTGCVPAGSNQRKSLAMPSSGLLALAAGGGCIFVLLFLLCPTSRARLALVPPGNTD